MNPIIFTSIPKAIDLGNNVIVPGEIITHVTIPREIIDHLMNAHEELTHLRIHLPQDACIVRGKAYETKQRVVRNKVIELKEEENTLQILLTQKPIPGPTKKGFES